MDIQKLIRANIRTLEPYTSARDEYQGITGNNIFLDANENPNSNGVNRYPDPFQIELKEEISKMKGIPKGNIFLGNGSDEVLDLIFRVFCEPNKDRVITLPPTYGMYEVLANTNAIEVIKIALKEDFQPNVMKILNTQYQQAKLLFLCSPNNPTANSFNASNIEKLLKDFNGIVVIDEAYIDFSENKSWISRLNEFKNLIVIQTLSKAYGLAGIRLGVGYASTEIISILNKIKAPYNVNSLTQQRAIKALKLNDKEKQVEDLLKERNRLFIALNEIDYVKRIYPSDANFILIKVDDATMRYEQLLKKGIVVRNRTNQLLCKNCLRITVGLRYENEILINVLQAL